MNILKKIALALLVILILAQFFGPEKNQGEFNTDAFMLDTNPPKDVKFVFRDACYDCHSNVTNYPWYSNITPVNYWLNHHIEEGKEHFNVSDWEGLSVERKDHKIEEVIEVLEENEMPLNSYTWAHPEAKLSEAQKAAVINWAKRVRVKYALEDKPE